MHFMIWTVTANYFLFAITLPTNKFLFGGTLPTYKFLFGGRAPANNLFLFFLQIHTRGGQKIQKFESNWAN